MLISIRNALIRGTSVAVIATAFASAERASAQVVSSGDGNGPAIETVNVTSTRIANPGFDAPTPTTVIGAEEIQQANRITIGEMLADEPAFRAAGTPATTNGSTNSSASVVDLRGLGSGFGGFSASRTLTLLDGHRFVGSNDLNTVPQSLIERVDVVTGGASAAWGSGAVAGVVNFILKDHAEGLTIGTDDGISSRGDGGRYGVDMLYGTEFAGAQGHILVAADYLRDQGLFGRGNGSRPNLDSNFFATNSGQLFLANNVNSTVASPGGVITSGALAGMEFNSNGSLSPVPLGSQTNSNSTIGGSGVSGGDFSTIAAPFNRANVYSRATYEVSDALKLTADLGYTKMWDNFRNQPEEVDGSSTDGIAIQKDNPFLTPAVRAQLASGPQTFYIGKIFTGPEGFETLRYSRRTLEGSVGASGLIGGSWTYDAYANHGEIRQSQGFYNQRIEANFEQAVDAVSVTAANVGSSGLAVGSIVCRVALTIQNTPCQPLNIFGTGNASQAAINYAYATNPNSVDLTTTQYLTNAGFTVHGDPFSIWAGPVSVAFGADYRKEGISVDNTDPLSAAGALGSFDNTGTAGSFDVKEGFFEGVAPIVDFADTVKIDLNGAVRYSDYSTAGGSWAYKYGGTVRLFDDLLLRSAYSQDIRAPNVSELFTAHSQSILTVVDPTRNNQTVNVNDFSGGNTALKPEISHTVTVGGTYSPHFIPGFSMSLDYYSIIIGGAIGTLSAQDTVDQCAQGNAVVCAQITRNGNGLITTINNTYFNLESFKTHGLDMEVAYVMPLSQLIPMADGTIKLRSLTSYVPSLIINDGVSTINRAGDVGDLLSFNAPAPQPKWRSVETISYDNDTFGVDARVRYVGGGLYDSQQPIVNNAIGARTYFDLGGHVNIDERWTISADVQNLFDVAPPYVLYASPFYDEMGTYFHLRAQMKL